MDYPDSGFVNSNDKKTSASQPDWRGTINVSPEMAAQIAKDGKFDIAMWNKPPNNYGPFMSAKISVAWKKTGAAATAKAQPKSEPIQDDFNQDPGF